MERPAGEAGSGNLRWAVGVVAAVVSFVTLWAAGFRLDMVPGAWAHLWERAPVPLTPAPAALRTPALKAFDSPAPLGGLDSSVSTVPRRLILTGTILGQNARDGRALIGVDAHNPQTYTAGALLANGVSVAEIYKDYVILRKGDQSARLYVQGAVKAPDEQALNALLAVGGTNANPAAAAPSSFDFTDYIRPNPVYEGAEFRGYEVYPGSQPLAFSRLGLQPGDLITVVDGAPLNEPRQAVEFFQELTQGRAVTAVVVRKGREESLSLDGAVIEEEGRRARTAFTP